ncbi:MAG: AMP-binding protein [Pseudohongiella sp.]|nr:AMP-binding protein [Pseudohongiella sp.]MDO9520755.1 AMP-binding protein [Pseudohongiella sp.]MDP2126960.1 AMP-binding protein [Pseudohongiella sp.]
MDKIWNQMVLDAQTQPEQIAVIDISRDPVRQLTRQQLVQAVTALAREFSARSYEAVALYAGNSADWIIVDLACRLADVALLPLPGFFSSGQIRHALKTVPVDVVLTDRPAHLHGQFTSFVSGEKLSVRLEVLVDAAAVEQPPATQQFDDIARLDRGAKRRQMLPPRTRKITFTSGSTGDPKGVCLSTEHQQLVAMSLSGATSALQIRKHLCVLPLATLLENIAGVYAPLLQGACIMIASDRQLGFNGAAGFSVPDLLATISTMRPNSLILMPQLLQALVQSCDAGWHAPDSLRFIAVGGGSVNRALLDKAWQSGLPVYEGYGLSECGSVVALNTPQARRNGSLGKPLPHVHTRMIDNELWVSGAAFLGYAGDIESWTAQESSAWVHTGDLCEVDADGFLHFQGRRKNLIVSSYGRNISPEWVERELSHSVLITQVIVSGDSRPFCVALIAARDQSVSNQQIQKIVDEANRMLPEYARVQRWHRLENLIGPGAGAPTDLMTTNGRPRRSQIEQYFQAEIDALYVSNKENEYAC